MNTFDDTSSDLLDREDEEEDAVARSALGAGVPFKNHRLRLTMAVGRNAPPPPQGDYILWDIANGGLGFGLRVYASGLKSWIVQKKQNGKPVRIKIGSFPTTTCTKALKEAKRVNGEFIQGLNPNLEKKKRVQAAAEAHARASLTVAAAYLEYEEAKKDGAGRSNADRRKARELLEGGKLWRRPLLEVAGEDLHEEYNRLISRSKKGTNGGATQAGATVRWLRSAYNYAVKKRRLNPPTPFHVLNDLAPGWYRTAERKRIIASHETQLANWWKAVEKLRTKDKTDDQKEDKRDGRMRHAQTIADYLQLSLLFGSRKSEILPLQWTEVDLINGLVIFPDTKNGKDHIVPFGPYARDILTRRFEANDRSARKSHYVFPSSRRRSDCTYSHIQQPQNTLQWVIKESGVPFSQHDLRRTFATLIEELEAVTTATLERLLNHAPSTVAGKHYVHQRMGRLRPLYQRLENSILVEAGVKTADATTPTLTPEAMDSISAFAQVDVDGSSKAEQVLSPNVASDAIRVRKEGDDFIASIAHDDSFEAVGRTPKEAIALLQMLREG